MAQHRPDLDGVSGKKVVLVGLMILTVLLAVPTGIAAIVIADSTSSWGERPALARDLVATDASAMSSAFRDRVILRFPVGTPETELLGELRTEGFVIKSPRHALFKRPGLCRNEWRVSWQAADGAVTAITGSTPNPPSCL